MSHVISLQAVSKSFGDAVVLHETSLTIRRGTLTAIVGPSGSGKSTLLNIIAGLTEPDKGNVLVLGHDLRLSNSDEKSRMRLEHIGIVFQFFHLLPSLTAFDNARLPGLLLKRGSVEDTDRRVKELFERFDLQDKATCMPQHLSGGQMQRVGIIRALCNTPKIVLADEPTGNLDSASGQQVFSLLRHIVDEDGVTVVVVTHESELAMMADEVISIRDGVCTKVRGSLESSFE